ncbi:kelch repeat-containing protein [Sorangium sp. So ce375]|uniref:kelch repeat-containing protein n=1 Tax=Sorangium sp. So ce375 TaxID=3133306 RepID=UPI003F5C717E
MHSHSLFRRWLFILSSLIFGGALSAGGVGCALGPEPPAGDELRRQFPEQAPQVLETSEAFVAVDGGFARASAGDLSRGIDVETLLPRGRGALEATMPALGEEAIRLRLPDGFEARVREVGAEGEGAVVERAVAYPRKGGTSFWAARDDGYEEWLMLEAGVAHAGAPVAAWEVEGATLRQQGDAVEVVDDTGTARLRVTAPAAFALGGRPIAARLTARGATLELWADAGGEPALIDPLWAPAGTLSAARHSHTATQLQSGKVLVAGGANSTAIVASAELYDPVANSWSAAGSLATGRRNHAAVTLSTGKVLVMGGRSFSGGSVYASAELYDPATDTWSPAAPMTTSRYGHTATLLPNDRVLVTGGSDGPAYLTSAELYDPATNTWSPAAPMTTSRLAHTATLLLDGRVLVTGGRNSSYPTNAALYHWQTNSWSSAGDMDAGRYNHTATRLLDGRVLVTGGYNIVSLELSSAEIFNPSTLTWTAAHRMNVRRNLHAAALLPNGQVLVTGGTVSNSLLVSTANVELYSPSINTWTECQSMIDQRTLHTATVLASGKVLLTGGLQYSGSTAVDLASAEVFDRAATPWVLTPPMAHAHRGFFATRFYDGRVLAAGGDIGSGSKAADVYDPNTNTWTSVAPTAEVHEWATITGFVNNKVLVAGGTASTTAKNAELYDPATNTWSSVGTGSLARENHTATLLYNGKALIVGGWSTSINNTVLANTRLFDPAGNSWTATASMGIARYGHTATLLANGKVLVTGGSSTGGYQATAEIYDPATNTWSPVPSMGQPRIYHTATLMGDGNVLVVGGDNDDEYSLVSTEIYRPSSNDWVYGANISVGRSSHTATALNDGRVLVAGGWTFNPLPPNGLFKQASASIYDPVSNTWTAVGPMRDHRVFHSAVLLGDGSVLIASGTGPSALPGTATALTTAEIFSP